MRRFFPLFVFLVLVPQPLAHADHHLEGGELAGVWHVKAQTDNGPLQLRWSLRKDGGHFRGTSQRLNSGETRNFDRIKVKEDSVTLEMDIERDGNAGVVVVKAKESSSGKLSGRWSVENDEGSELLGGELTAWKAVHFAGQWEATAELPDGGSLDSIWTLQGDNSKLVGSIQGDATQIEIDQVRSEARSVRFEFDFPMNGNVIDCVIEAEADGDNKLVGRWKIPDLDGREASGKWSAQRKIVGVAGQWMVSADTPNGPYRATLTIAEQAGELSGTSKSSDGNSRKLQSIEFDGEELVYSFGFEGDGFVGSITVQAKLQPDGSLKGEWVAKDEDGLEVARDRWSASR